EVGRVQDLLDVDHNLPHGGRRPGQAARGGRALRAGAGTLSPRPPWCPGKETKALIIIATGPRGRNLLADNGAERWDQTSAQRSGKFPTSLCRKSRATAQPWPCPFFYSRPAFELSVVKHGFGRGSRRTAPWSGDLREVITPSFAPVALWQA